MLAKCIAIFTTIPAPLETWIAVSACRAATFLVCTKPKPNRIEVDVPVLFREMITTEEFRENGWLLVHNHHHEAKPSDMDLATTGSLAFIGQQLGIPLVDHWIIVPGESSQVFSFANDAAGYLDPDFILSARGKLQKIVKAAAEKGTESGD